MRQILSVVLTHFAIACLWAAGASGGEAIFVDDFNGKLGPGWSWVREEPKAWRVTEQGLEVRIQPGNMWGSQNNARNVLVRAVPEVKSGGIEVAVNVENKPSHQYEQVDLVWYYDDSNMVKLGQELVNGQLSVVMGREENDKPRTVKIVPLEWTSLELRFLVKGTIIRGQFRATGTQEWREVGECDLPAPMGGRPKISLQFYQGAADVERWAKIKRFRILRQE